MKWLFFVIALFPVWVDKKIEKICHRELPGRDPSVFVALRRDKSVSVALRRDKSAKPFAASEVMQLTCMTLERKAVSRKDRISTDIGNRTFVIKYTV